MEGENQSAATEQQQQQGTGKIVGKGQISSFKATPLPDVAQQPLVPNAAPVTDTSVTEPVTPVVNTQIADTTPPAIQTPEAVIADTTKPLSDEELRAEYEKRFPTAAVLTEEDKQKQESAFEKRMLDLYVEGGGKIDEFALLKQIAATDLTELSKTELTKELKEAGFNETEIAAIQKERYYQLDAEELEQLDDETEKQFAQRKAEYGKNKLEGKGKLIKENAVDFLNNLKEAVNQKDLFTTRESEFVSNVEAHFNKVERKVSLQLGKVDDIELAPVEYEFPESVIAEAKDELKDISKRKKLLFNEKDGSLNLESISGLVLKAKAFDSAVKTGFLEGQTRQVEEFKKIFPFVDAKSVGVGGSSQSNNPKGTGKIVSKGTPQRFTPNQR